MASSKVAWGIEVGSYAIKAIRLEREGSNVVVSDFAIIPHKKVLTTPDLDVDEMIRVSLGQLISQKSLENERIVISVPGHSAFARFAKLPPVEPKKVPDIVKFEAVQQIPFPIDQVEWDYQAFASDESPEIEVGIFAITNDRLEQRLPIYADVGLTPENINLSPVAVYNALHYDLELGDKHEPIVFLDIGTMSTDLIIAEDNRCWVRTFPIGGTHFTKAVEEKFKLSYGKAQKLKHEAATHKYAKQIMSAMKDQFDDLLQDITRSIGYYHSLHPDSEPKTVIGVGSTFKIPGLRRFLGDTLNVKFERLDEFKRISVQGREAADFASASLSMATAYGLALQGVGLAPIDINLAPVTALREQVWHSKIKWFAAAAAVAVIATGVMFTKPLLGNGLISSEQPVQIRNAISTSGRHKNAMKSASSILVSGHAAPNLLGLLGDREVWPHLVTDATEAVASASPGSVELSDDLERIRQMDPGRRQIVLLEDLNGTYRYDEKNKKRYIDVGMAIAFSNDGKQDFLNKTILKWLRDNEEREGVPYTIIKDSVSLNQDQFRELAVGPGGLLTEDSTSLVAGNSRDGGGRNDQQRRPNRDFTGGNANQGSGLGGGFQGKRQGAPRIKESGSAGLGIGNSGASGNQGGSGNSFGNSQELEIPDDTPPPTRGGANERQKTPVDVLAPIPGEPGLFSEGQKFFRTIITFTVMLKEPGDQTSSGNATESAPASTGTSGQSRPAPPTGGGSSEDDELEQLLKEG